MIRVETSPDQLGSPGRRVITLAGLIAAVSVVGTAAMVDAAPGDETLATALQLRPILTGASPPCGDWSGSVDVELSDMSSVGQGGIATVSGRSVVVVLPSTEIKNAGTANVPWYAKFTNLGVPPWDDQHPFEVWQMLRSSGGVLEPIGKSDLFHASLTTNSGCDPGACTDSQILGLGCENIHGTATHNSVGSLAPRFEVTASTGIWNHCGGIPTHFDTNGDCVQDFFGSGENSFTHGLKAAETDLQVAGASYYVEAFSVVRNDINIFNSMGYRQVAPAKPATTWTFPTVGAYAQGPAINAWVNPTAPGPDADNEVLDTGEGRLQLAVKITDVAGFPGRKRFAYALQNHDFDRQISSFRLPVPAGAVVAGSAVYADGDGFAANNWTVTVDVNGITFTALAGTSPHAELDYATLVSFRFDSESPPLAVPATLGVFEAGSPIQLQIQTLAPTTLGLIGDFVWRDSDGNGVQDGGESGIAGVTLDLIGDANGSGTIDGGEAVLDTQTTNGSGLYLFDNLVAGSYIVSVTDTGSVLTGLNLTGGTQPHAVALAIGQEYTAADFGYDDPGTGSIGDFIWRDNDGDGVQDGGEGGIAGVTLDLIDDANGSGTVDGGEAVLDTQTTSGSGLYLFDNLDAGSYIVSVTDSGNVLTGLNLTGGTQPHPVALAIGQAYTSADFGYDDPGSGSIGDLVWRDDDGDGVQDGGESGIPGVTVDLIDDANGSGTVDGGEAVLDTQTTSGSGLYLFDNLDAGSYIVSITDTGSILTGLNLTGGTEPHAVGLAIGQPYTTADFGYDEPASAAVSISKTSELWVDINDDGALNPGDTLRYAIIVHNAGPVAALAVVVTDDPDPSTTLAVGTVDTTAGSITVGNNPGDTTVEAVLGDMAVHATETMHFEVVVSPVPGGNQIFNQALGQGDNFEQVASDDPNTTLEGDSTADVVVYSIPTLGESALLLLSLSIATAAIYQRRRRG